MDRMIIDIYAILLRCKGKVVKVSKHQNGSYSIVTTRDVQSEDMNTGIIYKEQCMEGHILTPAGE